MKSTKMPPMVQLDRLLDICVDVSKSKLNVYFELGDQAFDDTMIPKDLSPSCGGSRTGVVPTTTLGQELSSGNDAHARCGHPGDHRAFAFDGTTATTG